MMTLRMNGRSLGPVVAFVAMVWAALAAAQTAPEAYQMRTHDFIADFAMVLPDQEEQALATRLEKLRSETGVEMVVVSLNGLPGGESQLEAYATGLFNAWGIGDAERNNGVLLLFSLKDRAVRLELGRAYGQGYDVLAQDIVSRALVPAFRDGRYLEGVSKGIDLVRKEIVLPFSGGGSAKSPTGTANWMSYGIPALLVFAFGAIVLQRRAKVGPTACPQCGTPLVNGSRPIHQKRLVTCPNCGWNGFSTAPRHERPDQVSDRRENAEGGSGGGSSSGGGASGRW